jgi:hypothetical protein
MGAECRKYPNRHAATGAFPQEGALPIAISPSNGTS